MKDNKDDFDLNKLDSEDKKAGRQGGGPSERQSRAGEMGAKAEEPNDSIRSHTQAGEVHGAGTLKDGSSKDQAEAERGQGTSLHLGDDYRIHNITGEQNGDVRPQTGTANHEGGNTDGKGGGHSSGGAGHGPQNHSSGPTSGPNNPENSPKGRVMESEVKGGTDGNPENYEGYEGGTPPDKFKSGGEHMHRGEFPPRTRQDPNAEGSSAGSH